MKRHNLKYGRAKELSRLASDPHGRCEICGVPVWWLNLMGFWPYGGPNGNKRLSIDHIVPGEPEPLRILCYSCNAFRGHAERTDVAVLRFMRKWYREHFGLRYLWWLHTVPGLGGRAHRNVTCDERERLYAAGITDSTSARGHAVCT